MGIGITVRLRRFLLLLGLIARFVAGTAWAENITLTYDADGQRVSLRRTESELIQGETSSNTQRFLIDSLAPNGFPQVIAELNHDGAIRQFLHGIGPLVERSETAVAGGEAEPKDLILDGMGSVRTTIPSGVADVPQPAKEVSVHDAFGVELGSGGASAHRFRGEWFERSVGLIQLRSRWYRSAQGRFITRDSFEGTAFRPSSLHKYSYAEGDPVNRLDPSGYESLTSLSAASAIGTRLHSLHDEVVTSTGFALTDTIQGVEAGMTADAIYRDYLVGSTLGLGLGMTMMHGGKALTSLRSGFRMTRESSVARRLFALLGKSSYWENAGGISILGARQVAGSHGFELEIGRFSRFENARNAVVIGRDDLIGGEINRIMLAEEIQHGLDRATSEASQAIKRGLDNLEFHVEVFHRIIKNHERGQFPFLTVEDIQGLKAIIAGLQ